jgi:hypothetical protein
LRSRVVLVIVVLFFFLIVLRFAFFGPRVRIWLIGIGLVFVLRYLGVLFWYKGKGLETAGYRDESARGHRREELTPTHCDPSPGEVGVRPFGGGWIGHGRFQSSLSKSNNLYLLPHHIVSVRGVSENSRQITP